MDEHYWLWVQMCNMRSGKQTQTVDAGRNAAVDAVSYAFQENLIGLDTDTAMKLNCEVPQKCCAATESSVREVNKGDNQGHILCLV